MCGLSATLRAFIMFGNSFSYIKSHRIRCSFLVQPTTLTVLQNHNKNHTTKWKTNTQRPSGHKIYISRCENCYRYLYLSWVSQKHLCLFLQVLSITLIYHFTHIGSLFDVLHWAVAHMGQCYWDAHKSSFPLNYSRHLQEREREKNTLTTAWAE